MYWAPLLYDMKENWAIIMQPYLLQCNVVQLFIQKGDMVNSGVTFLRKDDVE